MELYVTDSNYVKTTPVDIFTSLVWTERYSDYGEVVLTLPATTANRALIKENVFLSMSKSKEIMLIEDIQIENNLITAMGKTLVAFLRNRLFRPTWRTTASAWGLSNPTASNAINGILRLLVTPATMLTDGRVLTSAQGTNEIFPKLTTSPDIPGDAYQGSVEYGNIYDAIKKVADADGIGFIMYPPNMDDGTGNLLFQCYRGLNRTTAQSTNNQVIFDPSSDTLTATRELRSISGYKNVAWVWPSDISDQTQIVAVYLAGAQASTGFNRRTLMVEASDVSVANYSAANLAIVLRQRGLDALANNNYVRMSDGQIVPQNAYVYGTDYNLGDIIELRGPLNTVQSARITEYTYTQDSTGEKQYPTLSVIA